MQTKQNPLLRMALAIIASTTLLIGGATRGGVATEAEAAENTQPTISETKSIAEEGFIYGLLRPAYTRVGIGESK
jgi:hypothetical protein